MDKINKSLTKWVLIFIVLFVLGIILITIYHSLNDKEFKFIDLVGTVGKTILGSGVFLAILKSIQFSGVFKDELRKIVFSEEILSKRNDIRDIWSKVTQALYQSAFPTISVKLEQLIQSKILPEKLNYYHKDLHVTYEITEVDKSHFRIIESQNFVIISNGDDFNFELNNQFIKTSYKNDLSELVIETLEIDGQNHAEKVNKSKGINIGDDQIQFDYKCEIGLSGKREYNVKKITNTIHTNLLNGYWKFAIGRVTDSFTLDLRCSRKFEMDLIPIGKNTEFHNIFLSSKLNISKHYDLLMPGDGFLILIKPKLR